MSEPRMRNEDKLRASLKTLSKTNRDAFEAHVDALTESAEPRF
jgi:hypothetical protein